MRNEEVILPYFLRHYGSFADRIFVWEDGSTDKTREILAAHPKVTVLDVETHGINDVYWVTKLWPQYEQLSRGRADWVICVDADEFVYHPSLINVLEWEKTLGTQLIHCQGYSMIADAPPTTSGQIYEEIQYGLQDRWSSKWIIFDPEIYIRFHRGRHGPSEEITPGIIMRAHTGIKLLHYRYLGAQYYEARDIEHAERYIVADKLSSKYSPKRKHNMPDDTQGIPLQWYEKHKGEAWKII